MAALQSIRSRGKLIAICVGGALLAFVLGDFINSGATIFGASQTKIGDINGTSIDYNEFMGRVEQRETFMKLATGRSTLDAQTTEEIRDYCWEQAVRENTVGKFLDKQGVQATDDELVFMIKTGNVTPFMRQAFANPETGMFEPARVTAYAAQTDPESRFIWNNLETELRESREYVKYISMVSSGLYVTNAEVETEFKNRTHISDFKYVALPISEVKDEEISVTDAALKDYYSKNQNAFFRSQESRDVAYVSFDVIPSKEDSAVIRESVEKLKAGLQEVEAAEVQDFINSRSNIPYRDYHYNQGEIQNAGLDEVIFNGGTPGMVYGPYVEGEYYKIARLIDFKTLADSVKASHILLAFRNPADSLSVKAKADSLMNVLKSGIDFGALAVANSEDPGSARDSGNLGWIVESTPFIPEFKNACFDTEKGKTTIVKSTYGYHIIKVTDKTQPKRKASVGFVSVEIRPSKQTRSAAYVKASEFAGKNRTLQEFEKAIEDEKLIRRIAPNLTSNTRQIPGIENSRELVRWAFDNDKSKEVSQIMEFGDRYIVAALTGVHKKGISSLDAVKSSVAAQVANSLKGDKLVEKLQGQTVDGAAASLGKPVQEAHAVNFEMVQIPGIGFEPAVIAAASALQSNQTSAPIKGNNAVYLLQNTSYTPSQEIQPLNITTDKKQMENELRYRASYQISNAINQLVNIDDRRVKFF